MSLGVEKSCLTARVESWSGTLVDLCRSPVRIDSIYPPGDTTAIVEVIEAVLDAAAGIEHRRVVGRAPAVNLVARTRGASPGRRLVLNDHLDTFPIGEARWSHPPLGAALEDGRIYGRGACDMKAGVAALVLAFVTLTEFRDAWRERRDGARAGRRREDGRAVGHAIPARECRGGGGREASESDGTPDHNNTLLCPYVAGAWPPCAQAVQVRKHGKHRMVMVTCFADT